MRVRVCELRVSPELNIENGAKSSKARALFGRIYVQGTKNSQTRKLAGSVWGSLYPVPYYVVRLLAVPVFPTMVWVRGMRRRRVWSQRRSASYNYSQQQTSNKI